MFRWRYSNTEKVFSWLNIYVFNHNGNLLQFELFSYLLQSEKACQISQHQLVVALRLRNPVLAAQCKVFAAVSLIQRGQLKLASRIIRFVNANSRVSCGLNSTVRLYL